MDWRESQVAVVQLRAALIVASIGRTVGRFVLFQLCRFGLDLGDESR